MLVKELGREVGFDLVRVASAESMPTERERYLQWVQQSRHGDMGWITPERVERATTPSVVLAGVRSIACVGMTYWGGHRPSRHGAGAIARYAWGSDYHAVLGERLQALSNVLQSRLGGAHRWYVDTGPLMDKALAARSGLGWYGKNTNVLTEGFGSWVLLGEILTTLEIEPDQPLRRDCGTCRLCVAACPTGALGPDYTIDSGKCISYLTIEHRRAIPRELRAAIGAWVFGCDICQDVCPPTMAPYLGSGQERRDWARYVRGAVSGVSGGLPHQEVQQSIGAAPAATHEPASPLFSERMVPHVDLVWLLRMTHDEYVAAFRGTSIKRAKDWMLRRNAAVALGNVGDETAVSALGAAMCLDVHPIVRSHSAWALGRLAARQRLADVRGELAAALATERDPDVRQEIVWAIRDLDRDSGDQENVVPVSFQ
jgi:epoxyqueuosine reductase